MNTYNKNNPRTAQDKWMSQRNKNTRCFLNQELYRKIQSQRAGLPECFLCEDQGCHNCSPVEGKTTLLLFLLALFILSSLGVMVCYVI